MWVTKFNGLITNEWSILDLGNLDFFRVFSNGLSLTNTSLINSVRLQVAQVQQEQGLLTYYDSKTIGYKNTAVAFQLMTNSKFNPRSIGIRRVDEFGGDWLITLQAFES